MGPPNAKEDRGLDRFNCDRDGLAANPRLRDAYPRLGALHAGGISREDFFALRDAMFHSGDIDHDDYISPDEYEILVLLRRTGWADRNADDRIEKSELRDVLLRSFPPLDTDHNGMLTPEESTFISPAHREEMDPGHTGRITPEQLVNGYRWLLRADLTNRNRSP